MASNSPLPVIILPMYVKDEHVLGAIKAGAWDYILKSPPGQELVGAIRTLHRGGSVLNPGVTKTVLQEFRRLAEDSQ
jgi:DNA-binding NarL/FixJ family response regulator